MYLKKKKALCTQTLPQMSGFCALDIFRNEAYEKCYDEPSISFSCFLTGTEHQSDSGCFLQKVQAFKFQMGRKTICSQSSYQVCKTSTKKLERG